MRHAFLAADRAPIAHTLTAVRGEEAMRQLKPVSWLAVALLVVAGLPPAGTRAAEVNLATVATGFDRPLFVTGAGTNDEQRLFVVEQAGIIRVVDVETGQHSPFLDITGIVNDEANERGLLGLAFHPNYETNRLFYVDYTRGNGDIVVARYEV